MSPTSYRAAPPRTSNISLQLPVVNLCSYVELCRIRERKRNFFDWNTFDGVARDHLAPNVEGLYEIWGLAMAELRWGAAGNGACGDARLQSGQADLRCSD